MISSEEFISGELKYFSIIYKKDFDRVINELKLISQNNSDKDYIQQTYRLVSKDGKVIWIEDRTTIIRDEFGRITHFEGLIVDITDRKKIEDENIFKTEFERKIASISTYFVNLNLKNINRALSFTAKSFGRFLNSDRSYIVLLNNSNEYIVKAEFVEDESNFFMTETKTFNFGLYN